VVFIELDLFSCLKESRYVPGEVKCLSFLKDTTIVDNVEESVYQRVKPLIHRQFK
jgi:hypothetical protein